MKSIHFLLAISVLVTFYSSRVLAELRIEAPVEYSGYLVRLGGTYKNSIVLGVLDENSTYGVSRQTAESFGFNNPSWYITKGTQGGEYLARSYASVSDAQPLTPLTTYTRRLEQSLRLKSEEALDMLSQYLEYGMTREELGRCFDGNECASELEPSSIESSILLGLANHSKEVDPELDIELVEKLSILIKSGQEISYEQDAEVRYDFSRPFAGLSNVKKAYLLENPSLLVQLLPTKVHASSSRVKV